MQFSSWNRIASLKKRPYRYTVLPQEQQNWERGSSDWAVKTKSQLSYILFGMSRHLITTLALTKYWEIVLIISKLPGRTSRAHRFSRSFIASSPSIIVGGSWPLASGNREARGRPLRLFSIRELSRRLDVLSRKAHDHSRAQSARREGAHVIHLFVCN